MAGQLVSHMPDMRSNFESVKEAEGVMGLRQKPYAWLIPGEGGFPSIAGWSLALAGPGSAACSALT